MAEQTNWVVASPTTEGSSLPPYVIEAGGLLRQTRALLYSDLLHSDGTLAFVYGDPTDSYNAIYIKRGPSGSGSWVFTLSLALLLQIGSGGVPTGTSRTVTANSPVEDRSVTVADANGVIFVDGAFGAFDMTFDPNLQPGMGVHFSKDDSSDNLNAINIKGEGEVTKATLSANEDQAFLKSKINANGTTNLKRVFSGSSA